MTGMQYLTLDTGHTRVSFRDEIDPGVLARLRPLTVPGEHQLPNPPGGAVKVTVDGTAALVTVFRTAAPLVTFGVAADEARRGGPVAADRPARHPAAVGGAMAGSRPGNRRSGAPGRPRLAG